MQTSSAAGTISAHVGDADRLGGERGEGDGNPDELTASFAGATVDLEDVHCDGSLMIGGVERVALKRRR